MTENLPIKEGKAVLTTPAPLAAVGDRREDQAIINCLNVYFPCGKLSCDISNASSIDEQSKDINFFSWITDIFSRCSDLPPENDVSCEQLMEYANRKCVEYSVKEFIPPKTLGRLYLTCIGASDLKLGKTWRRIAVNSCIF